MRSAHSIQVKFELGSEHSSLTESAQISAAISLKRIADALEKNQLWDYYQNFLKEHGYEGITDLLTKANALMDRPR